MTKQQVANGMLKDFPWDGNELVSPLTLPGALLAPSYVEQKLIATPSNPPVGSLRLYPKSDGKYYQLDSNGNEQIISGVTLSQTDGRYLPLTGGTLTGPLTVQGGLTAQNIVSSGNISGANVIATTYKWTPDSDGEVLSKDMPGRLRLSGAQLTIDQNLNVGAFVQYAEIATPVTPGTGQIRLYGKADHNLYVKDNSGTEKPLLTQTLADTKYDALGAAATGDAAHVATTDPHPIYLTAAEGDARYAVISGGPGGTYLTDVQADARYIRQDGTKSMSGNLTFTPDNAVDIGAVGARPRDLLLGRDLLLARDVVAGRNLTAVGATLSGSASVGGSLTITGALNFGSSNEQIIWSSSATEKHFQMLSTDQTASISGKIAAELLGNAWWNPGVDGWRSWDNTKGAAVFVVDNTSMAFYNSPASTGAISWTKRFGVDPNGTLTTPVVTISGLGTAGFVGNLRNGDFGIACRTANYMRIGANSTIAFWANDGAFVDDAPQMSLSSAGTLTVGGAVSTGGLTAASLTVNGGATINNTTNIVVTNPYGVASAAGGIAPFMIQAGGPSQGGGASMICFHRPGSFATYFGLDNDNVLRYGGWSMGAAAYRVIFGDGYGNPGGISITSGIIQMSNCDIQQTRTLYGMNNGCYFTSSGSDTWSCLNHLSVGYDLTVGRTLTATGGNSTFSYVISNGGFDCNGPLYFNHNGGISITNNNSQFIFSQPPISTNGYYYFVNTTVAFYWNGSGLQNSNGAIYSSGFVATGAGTYNFGDSNVRISRPGNIMYFYAYDAQWAFIRTPDSFNCGYVDGGGFHNTSKKKYKQNILPIQDGLKIVTDQRVTPIRYAIKGKDPIAAIGFTAEDMSQVVPEVVGYDDEGPASINYSSLVAVLWDAVRTLNSRIEVLEKTA